MNLKNLQSKKLPDKPGVYFFHKGKDILYIGKATSLRDRTKSYFSNDLIKTRGVLLVDMVGKSDNIKWQATDSVLEALILEANLIKKHQPYYNTREKDDKSWNYVVITKEKLPKVILLRQKQLEMQQNFAALPSLRGLRHGQNFSASLAATFGPYTNGSQLQEALRIIRRIFPFLDDKNSNYVEFYKQINMIPDLADRSLYLQNIKNIKLFFSGKKKQILRNLKKEMKEFAKKREFEKAGEVKRQIFALDHINDVALLKLDPHPSSLNPSFRIEAYDIAHMSGKNMVGVMTVVEEGQARKSEYRKFNIRSQAASNDTGALTEVLERRFNHTEWPYPKLIAVDGGVAQLHAALKFLLRIGAKIPVVAVLKDEKHRPKNILGDKRYARDYERDILVANSEAHRFAITFHKLKRGKSFLPGK